MSNPHSVLSAVDKYARLGLQTNVETASPHRLILLLLDGALEKLRSARLALDRGDIAAKGSNIGWAMSIIDGLRASLNLAQGGQVAANLDALYDYMTRTLLQANLHNDADKLIEVERSTDHAFFAYATLDGHPERGVASFAVIRTGGERKFEARAWSRSGTG